MFHIRGVTDVTLEVLLQVLVVFQERVDVACRDADTCERPSLMSTTIPISFPTCDLSAVCSAPVSPRELQVFLPARNGDYAPVVEIQESCSGDKLNLSIDIRLTIRWDQAYFQLYGSESLKLRSRARRLVDTRNNLLVKTTTRLAYHPLLISCSVLVVPDDRGAVRG
jgi:hypothetical protein